MSSKEKLYNAFHKALNSNLSAFSGNDKERDIIFLIRDILDNCAVIPKNKLDNLAKISSRIEEKFGIEVVNYEKKLQLASRIKIDKNVAYEIPMSEINDKLLKDMIYYLENEEEISEVSK
jgi:hypothetical protein